MSALEDALAAYRAACEEVRALRTAWVELQEKKDHALVRLDELGDELTAATDKRERLILTGTEDELATLDMHVRDLEEEAQSYREFLRAFRAAGPERPDFKLVIAKERALRAREEAVHAYVRNLLAPLAKHRERITQAVAVLEATVPPGGRAPTTDDLLSLAEAVPDADGFDAILEKVSAECPEIFEPLP